MQNTLNRSLIQPTLTAGISTFKINSIKWLVETGYEVNTVQACDHFKIIWITQGTGTCFIDLDNWTFEPNHLFFIKVGQMHRLHADDDLDGYIISFNESFLTGERQGFDFTYHDNIFRMFIIAYGIKIEKSLALEMQDFAEKMIREYTGNNMYKEEMLRRYLKILFIYLSRQVEGDMQVKCQSRNIELTRKFMSLLEKNYRIEKTVFGYAGLLSVTPNYLNEIVKKTTGRSASHHIRQRIVFEAKRQATYSDSCMKQIGYYLGFDDMAHFSKFFKMVTGINFTDFKKGQIISSSVSPR